jgi:protein subunit release factor B
MIKDEDIEFISLPQGYRGGQHTNGPHSDLIACHKPSGVCVRIMEPQRSQYANRKEARSRLESVVAILEDFAVQVWGTKPS